ncbi:MAG: GIY-YIG nuclease family protein [Chitinophagales bacterium]|nr:GIY-YIG nuclease family protein [Chitinophagales bacterium]
MYAIVDIETTGSYAAAHGITEISIHVFDGEKVVEKFETLINPNQPIPHYIQAMTGITDKMAATAPVFETVAEKIYTILEGKIFVAHNVNFDYSFVKGHLAEAGFILNSKKLCTVRLSRKIFPGFASYSLGNLCHSLGITIKDRHRAGGDTEATVKVFQLLLAHDKEQHIAKSLQRNSKESVLPPNVPKEHFEQLPYTPGVYYFHNEKGKIVYVGKANNIRYRVNSHFSNNSESRQKQNFLKHIHAISFQPCATELMACILESTEIKKLWPIFNQSQKRWEDVYGIFSYEDQNGFLRLAIEKNKQRLTPVYSFHYLVDGHAILRKVMREFNLCPKLCFMQKDQVDCEGIKEGFCYGACRQKELPASYNERVQQAIESLKKQPSFAIVEKGLNGDDQSCILVTEGRFYGMGYLPSDLAITDHAMLKELLTPYKENLYIRNLINGYAARFPGKVKMLEGTTP